VIFGIRPDDVHDPKYLPQNILPSEIETAVDVTEPMGNEIFVYFASGDTSFVGRLDPRTKLKPGEKTRIAFNMANAHLFSPDGDRKAII
jgi:multiple sugar transport system ATP-binding protein